MGSKRAGGQAPTPRMSKRERKEKVLSLPTDDFKERYRASGTPPPLTLSQFEELHHLMINLGYQWEQLISKFQHLKNIDLDKIEGDEERLAATRTRILLAQLLIRAYWNNQLPLVDDILWAMKEQALGEVPLIRAFELGSVDLDQFQARIISQVKDALDQAKKRAKGLEMSQMKASWKSLKGIRNAKSDEAPEDTSDNDDYDISKWPPTLPEIRDPKLRQQTLTHRSFFQDALATTKKDRQRGDNERLEFKGDAILDFVVAEMLYDALPDADEGLLTRAKSSLVCNNTLSEFAHIYELPRQLRAKVDSDLLDKNSDKKHKIVADIFEAYIGGLSIDRGYGVVQKWLLQLYEPLVVDIVKTRHSAQEVDKTAKTELYKKIGNSQQPIVYDRQQDGEEYVVRCIVEGEVLGVGRDKSGKIAGCRAAMEALLKPDLIEKYAQRRRQMARTAPVTGAAAITHAKP